MRQVSVKYSCLREYGLRQEDIIQMIWFLGNEGIPFLSEYSERPDEYNIINHIFDGRRLIHDDLEVIRYNYLSLTDELLSGRFYKSDKFGLRVLYQGTEVFFAKELLQEGYKVSINPPEPRNPIIETIKPGEWISMISQLYQEFQEELEE